MPFRPGYLYVRPHMKPVPPDQLLFEIQDVIRAMPGLRDFSADPDTCIKWLGRASAAMNSWEPARARVYFDSEVRQYSSLYANRQMVDFEPFRHSLLTMLHQAESDLRLRTCGPLSVGLETGRVFEYFDELRRLIESARSDVFFVDPYLDAEFVSRFLPLVPDGTSIRLLGRERIASLKPAALAFASQYGHSVEIRSGSGFHDRYLFIDRQACYQSGASFKDGAKKAPTVLSQITDAFAAMHHTYEQLWKQAPAA